MTFLSVEDPSTKAEAMRHRVFDRDTGQEIHYVVWANDETGEYCQLLKDAGGKFLLDESGTDILRRVSKGNIELRKISE